MEKVITVLSEIEDKATKILDRTKDQKQQLYEQLNKDLAKLESEIKADTNAQIDVMQKNMDTEINNEKKKLIADCDMQLAAMQSSFTKNHDALVNDIFQRIIHV